MARAHMVVALGLIVSVASGAALAQGPAGRGLSVMVCIAEQGAALPAGSQVNIVTLSDNETEQEGVREAVVTINHGKSSSTHAVVYQDVDGSESLSCGDAVLGVF